MLQILLYSVPLLTAGAAGAAGTVAVKELVADPTHRCDACTEWNLPLAPFRVYGNTWYVGTAGLGAILITSDKGHVLIDGGLPQSAPLIAANIRAAGFRLEDVQLILNSHTHYDHAGGIAALQRASGARVGASPAARRALEQGGPTEDDPQYAFGHEHNDYAPVKNVFSVGDGETLRVGSLAITPHYTPGHTPGGTTWTWESCEADRCLNLVYADSLNSVSAPAFKFSADPARVAQFEKSMSRVEGLACDILLAPHPVFIALEPKLAAWKANPSVNPFIGDDACRSYANGARQRLKQRLADEAKTR
jgi:metallo-beta-lactamase class B